MRQVLLAVILAAATPASFELIPGSDAPSFRAPFDRALQDDNPKALAHLHVAAAAGNQTALLALPAVLIWLPSTGTQAGTDLSTSPRVPVLLQAAGIDQPTARANLSEAALVADIFGKLPLLIPRARAETAGRFLPETPEFPPIRSLCSAACPISAALCETDSIQAFGYFYPKAKAPCPITP